MIVRKAAFFSLYGPTRDCGGWEVNVRAQGCWSAGVPLPSGNESSHCVAVSVQSCGVQLSLNVPRMLHLLRIAEEGGLGVDERDGRKREL